MRPLRAPCVPALCAHFGLSLCVPRAAHACVPELCACVLGVWCSEFAWMPSLVNVVDIAGVRRPVLCSGAVHACARLRSPCSRCVHLLRVPALCVPALCAFVLVVWCACSARTMERARRCHRHTTSLVDLTCPYPFALLLLAHMHVPAMLY